MTGDERPPEAPSRPDEVTNRTAHSHLERRVAELEAERERLAEQSNAYRREASYLRERVAGLGRMVQLLVLVRGAVRHPSRLPQLPGRVMAVLRSRVSPPSVPPVAGTGEELPAEAEVARARQAVVARAVLERVAGQADQRSVAELRVALVADDELRANLAPDCDLVSLTPHTWREALEERSPDLLLVESAWRGEAGSWQYRVAWHGHPDAIGSHDLRALVDWCRERDVPTVFWHTEPAHQVRRFRHAAALFDHVVAADDRSVLRYEADQTRSAARVALAPHAVQPRHHHARGAQRAGELGPAFVGAWDPTAPLAHRDRLLRLLEAGAGHGLRIYDSRLGEAPGRFEYPDRLRECVAGRVVAADLPSVLRAHAVVLDAPHDATPLPQRTIEALACGATVVAASWSGGDAVLDELAVRGDAADELAGAVARALAAGHDPARAAARAARTLYRGHTYADRLAAMARAVGHRVVARRPIVTLLVPDERLDATGLRRISDALGGSAVVIGSPAWEPGRESQQTLGAALAMPVRLVEERADLPRGERIRRLAAAAEPGWVAVIGSEAPDEAELDALWAALASTDADVIHSAADAGLDRGVVLARRDTLLVRGWPSSAAEGEALLRDWSSDGVPVHAVGAAERPPNAAAVVAR